MTKTGTVAMTEQNAPLEHFNAVGMIFSDHLYVTTEHCLLRFNYNEIRKIYLRKKRKLKANYLVFATSCLLLFLTFFFLEQVIFPVKIGFSVVSCVVILYALLWKSYQYRVEIITNNQEISSVAIHKACKHQSLELIALVKQKIKQQHYLNAG